MTLHFLDFRNRDIRVTHERPDVYYYQKYLKDKLLYLVIVVKVFNGEGFIITIYKSRKPLP
ncbi:hypothetical protein HYS50_00450 [Candidatus Woesearchaeota archaeon]|nr:hypothetical protein [Candidatus Woesearchaeota archaeon]